jgi:drug/metabolite transporter (DMT)-like permease
MTTFASIFNTITFYFYFGEKIGCHQVLGVLFIFGCGVILGLAASMNNKENEEGQIS